MPLPAGSVATRRSASPVGGSSCTLSRRRRSLLAGRAHVLQRGGPEQAVPVRPVNGLRAAADVELAVDVLSGGTSPSAPRSQRSFAISLLEWPSLEGAQDLDLAVGQARVASCGCELGGRAADRLAHRPSECRQERIRQLPAGRRLFEMNALAPRLSACSAVSLRVDGRENGDPDRRHPLAQEADAGKAVPSPACGRSSTTRSRPRLQDDREPPWASRFPHTPTISNSGRLSRAISDRLDHQSVVVRNNHLQPPHSPHPFAASVEPLWRRWPPGDIPQRRYLQVAPARLPSGPTHRKV